MAVWASAVMASGGVFDFSHVESLYFVDHEGACQGFYHILSRKLSRYLYTFAYHHFNRSSQNSNTKKKEQVLDLVDKGGFSKTKSLMFLFDGESEKKEK